MGLSADAKKSRPVACLHPAFVWYCQECGESNYLNSAHVCDAECDGCGTSHKVES